MSVEVATPTPTPTITVFFRTKALNPDGTIGEVSISDGVVTIEITALQAESLARQILTRFGFSK